MSLRASKQPIVMQFAQVDSKLIDEVLAGTGPRFRLTLNYIYR